MPDELRKGETIESIFVEGGQGEAASAKYSRQSYEEFKLKKP